MLRIKKERYTNFDDIKIDKAWSFENMKINGQLTHGYHRYPSKISPDVVKKLFDIYANSGDYVADVFCGSGTTLVEAKARGLTSVGVDVNPIATLISEVKANPINPKKILKEYSILLDKLKLFDEKEFLNVKFHEKINFWFKDEEKYKIAFLYKIVKEIKNIYIRKFFFVAISHILKNCSIWLNYSIKPQRDKNKNFNTKNGRDLPFELFKRHCRFMIEKNEVFYNLLVERGFLDNDARVLLDDARSINLIFDDIVDLIVTSPPYVTSYEYADIHQLTGYWMHYLIEQDDLNKFRQVFIGTKYSGNHEVLKIDSKIGNKIIEELFSKNEKRTAFNLSKYFVDMGVAISEMYRILKKKGILCLIVGNTFLKNVEVKTAEILYDICLKTGFKKIDIIKRNVPNHINISLRDTSTGKFTTQYNKNCRALYTYEYILIFKK